MTCQKQPAYLAHKSWFLYYSSIKKNQDSIEKWLILGLEIYNKSPKHFVVAETKEMLKKKFFKPVTWDHIEGNWEPTERSLNGQSQKHLSKKTDKVALEYNWKYDVNTYEFILT